MYLRENLYPPDINPKRYGKSNFGLYGQHKKHPPIGKITTQKEDFLKNNICFCISSKKKIFSKLRI